MNSSLKTEKPRLCLAVTRSDIGGAQKHVELIAKGLCNEFEIEIVHGGGGEYFENSLAGYPVRITEIPAINSVNFLLAIVKFYQYLKIRRPDVIHVHSTLSSIYGRICGRLLSISVVYTVHGWFFANPEKKLIRWFGPFVERALKDLSVKTIFVSEFDQQLARSCNCVKSDSHVLVQNTVTPVDRQRKKKTNSSSTYRVMFVGRLKWQKDPLLAVQTVALCEDNISMTIYGEGPLYDQVSKYIASHKMEDQIQIVTDMDSLADEYDKHDCLLVTSRYEGMPLCMLEAMSAGLPIIAVDVCGLGEMVTHQKTGFLLKTRTSSDLAEYVKKLCSDRTLSTKLGTNGLSVFKNRFSMNTFLEKTRSVYMEVTQEDN